MATTQQKRIGKGIFTGKTYDEVLKAARSAAIKFGTQDLRYYKDRYCLPHDLGAPPQLSRQMLRAKLAQRINYGSRKHAYRAYADGYLVREACRLLAISPPKLKGIKLPHD